VKLKGENGVIWYKQGITALVFFYKYQQIQAGVSRRSSFTDAVVKAISKSTQCTEGEAAECLIKVLFKRYEEVFLSVTKNNGVIVPPEKKYMPYKLKLCSLNVGLGRIPHRYCFVI